MYRIEIPIRKIMKLFLFKYFTLRISTIMRFRSLACIVLLTLSILALTTSGYTETEDINNLRRKIVQLRKILEKSPDDAALCVNRKRCQFWNFIIYVGM